MTPAERIDALEAAATRVETACGRGTMPWRRWGQTGRQLVLIHGGSGSWLHWIRNIEALARDHRLLVPDLPGLGEAADVPEPVHPATVARIVADGLRELIPTEPFDLIAFSWGCTAAGGAATHLGEQVQSMFLTGPAALGDVPTGEITPLRRREAGMSEADLLELQRDNLRLLMLHQEMSIDDLATECQLRNASRSRFNSPRFARTDLLYQWLQQNQAPLTIIYGDQDRTARPHFARRRTHLFQARPDCRFETATGAGHWLQYERPGAWHGAVRRHLQATARLPTS